MSTTTSRYTVRVWIGKGTIIASVLYWRCPTSYCVFKSRHHQFFKFNTLYLLASLNDVKFTHPRAHKCCLYYVRCIETCHLQLDVFLFLSRFTAIQMLSFYILFCGKQIWFWFNCFYICTYLSNIAVSKLKIGNWKTNRFGTGHTIRPDTR